MPDIQHSASELLRAGRLDEAIEAANTGLRNRPADLGTRLLLSELLIFVGNLDRADTILDAAAQIDPGASIGIAEFRQLIRAALARRQCCQEGRLPEFLGEPTPPLRTICAARVALLAGDNEAAARYAAEAEELRPHVAGLAADWRFDDFRDADDLYAGFFEVMTTTGKYYWIPTERIDQIDFHPPRRLRDLAWRRASISVQDGPNGDVYIPAIYDSDKLDLQDDFRLGRATDWAGAETSFVRGMGQRVFLAGDDALGIMELSALRFGA